MNMNLFRCVIVVCLIGYSASGEAASNWGITSPGVSPIEVFWEMQTIFVTGSGTGTPGQLYGCRAHSQSSAGGFNMSDNDGGNYSYSYPQPNQTKTVGIDPTEWGNGHGNSPHKLGINQITWLVNDYPDGTGWVAKDARNVIIQQ